MSSFSFEEEPLGPGLVPTEHEEFEDAPQFFDPARPSFMGENIPAPLLNEQTADYIIPPEEDSSEDKFDTMAEQDVVGLIFLGFLQRSCDVLGHSFVLRTLTGAEDLAVAQIIDEQPGLASSGKALMYAQVAAALLIVDGKEMAAPLNDSFEQTVATIRKRIAYILQWHPTVVDRLFNEYQELQVRVSDAFKDYEGKLTAGRHSPLP